MSDDPFFKAAQERLLTVVRRRGADYYDRSFYGTVHEASHGLLLGLDRWDRASIDAALAKLPERRRMEEEVYAHRFGQMVCVRFHFPIFEDSREHSAPSTRAFALSRGEEITWEVEDFVVYCAASILLFFGHGRATLPELVQTLVGSPKKGKRK